MRWSEGSMPPILRTWCALNIARSAIVLDAREDFPNLLPGAIPAPRIGMAAVRRFEDFDCWKLANELKLAIYELVERPHVKTDRDFCDQNLAFRQRQPISRKDSGGDQMSSSLAFSILPVAR